MKKAFLIFVALFGAIASATLGVRSNFRVPSELSNLRHRPVHLDQFEDNHLQVRPSFSVSPIGSGSAAVTGGLHGQRNSVTGTVYVNPNSGQKFGGASVDYSRQMKNGGSFNIGPDFGPRGNLGGHVGMSGPLGRNGQWSAGGNIMSNPGGRPSYGANIGATWRF